MDSDDEGMAKLHPYAPPPSPPKPKAVSELARLFDNKAGQDARHVKRDQSVGAVASSPVVCNMHEFLATQRLREEERKRRCLSDKIRMTKNSHATAIVQAHVRAHDLASRERQVPLKSFKSFSPSVSPKSTASTDFESTGGVVCNVHEFLAAQRLREEESKRRRRSDCIRMHENSHTTALARVYATTHELGLRRCAGSTASEGSLSDAEDSQAFDNTCGTLLDDDDEPNHAATSTPPVHTLVSLDRGAYPCADVVKVPNDYSGDASVGIPHCEMLSACSSLRVVWPLAVVCFASMFVAVVNLLNNYNASYSSDRLPGYHIRPLNTKMIGNFGSQWHGVSRGLPWPIG